MFDIVNQSTQGTMNKTKNKTIFRSTQVIVFAT